jgi:AAA domain
MVLCYTNHALDQFLEDLMDIGIPGASMVRLGSKSTPRTQMLGLFGQSASTTSGHMTWSFIMERRQELDNLDAELKSRTQNFRKASISKDEMLEYLEFSDDSDFFESFIVPAQEPGMQQVGERGKKVNKYYLWDRWVNGRDAGIFKCSVNQEHLHIWRMPTPSRREAVLRWQQEILGESRATIVGLIEQLDSVVEELDEYFYHKKHSEILQQKRIIACTTTAAAKYARALRAAKPNVVLVEEAGEILESHILTAMTTDTRQLVLIGDHKQLRPKISNYNLSVEKGDGFDLNRSLFERLVIKGFPHTSLSKQHRMRPEISRLIRSLTYPDLQDAEETRNRPVLRGFQNNVIFVNHGHLETNLQNVKEKRDPTAKCSKQNLFEVQMALMVVRYLGQQGYGTDKIVILTPYLGQLSLLRIELSQTNDPILNDLDSNDLINAGLLDPGSAKLTRQPIRISTIGRQPFEVIGLFANT